MKTQHRDVFHAFLVRNADYEGDWEMPCIRTSKRIPNRILPFSKALQSRDYDQWIAFYERDDQIARVWNQPGRYLPILKRFRGVISPDFSLYRNMPLCMQLWNTYRGKALAHWWQENGIEVIPNIRFADARSYDFCFVGAEKNSTVAIGTHGCIKRKEDKVYFKRGLAEMVNRLHPKTMIVYGAAPENLFGIYKKQGLRIIAFESLFAQTRKKAADE